MYSSKKNPVQQSQDDEYSYHDSLQPHLAEGMGHFQSLFLLAEERTKSSGRKTAWPNGKTRRDSLNCKDFKRMIHSGSIVLSFLVISTKKFAVSHFVSPCARSCMKYRSVLKLFHYQQGRVHKFIEHYFLKWFCLLTLSSSLRMHRRVLTGVVCRVIAGTSKGQPSRSKRRVRLQMDKKQVSIPQSSTALLLSEIRLNQAFCRLWLSRATTRKYCC